MNLCGVLFDQVMLLFNQSCTATESKGASSRLNIWYNAMRLGDVHICFSKQQCLDPTERQSRLTFSFNDSSAVCRVKSAAYTS